MTRTAPLKMLFTFVALISVATLPKTALARIGKGSHGGGSHGKSSHGGGSFHSGGHSTFKGGGHTFGGSRSKASSPSAHLGWGRTKSGGLKGDSFAGRRESSIRPSGNFARNSSFAGGNFGSPRTSRNFGGFGGSQSATTSSRGSMSGWHSVGNLTARSAGRMSPPVSPRATASNSYTPRMGFSPNRFAADRPGWSRFSRGAPFSSDRSTASWGGGGFGNSGLSGSAFVGSGFGQPGLFSSFGGSSASFLPSLLLDGLLRLGTSFFGGVGPLEGSAVSLAVRALVSAITSNGFGQSGFPGNDFNTGGGGFGGNSGFNQAPVQPPCNTGAGFGGPDSAWTGDCGPNGDYPAGSNGFDSGSN